VPVPRVSRYGWDARWRAMPRSASVWCVLGGHTATARTSYGQTPCLPHFNRPTLPEIHTYRHMAVWQPCTRNQSVVRRGGLGRPQSLRKDGVPVRPMSSRMPRGGRLPEVGPINGRPKTPVVPEKSRSGCHTAEISRFLAALSGDDGRALLRRSRSRRRWCAIPPLRSCLPIHVGEGLNALNHLQGQTPPGGRNTPRTSSPR